MSTRSNESRRAAFAALVANYSNDLSCDESAGVRKHSKEFVRNAVAKGCAEAVTKTDPRLTSTAIGAMAVGIGKSVMTSEKVARGFIDVEIAETQANKDASTFLVTFDGSVKEHIATPLLAQQGAAAVLCRPGDKIADGRVSDVLLYAVEPSAEIAESYVAAVRPALVEGFRLRERSGDTVHVDVDLDHPRSTHLFALAKQHGGKVSGMRKDGAIAIKFPSPHHGTAFHAAAQAVHGHHAAVTLGEKTFTAPSAAVLHLRHANALKDLANIASFADLKTRLLSHVADSLKAYRDALKDAKAAKAVKDDVAEAEEVRTPAYHRNRIAHLKDLTAQAPQEDKVKLRQHVDLENDLLAKAVAKEKSANEAASLPLHHIFVDGAYVASTRKARTAKDAIAAFKANPTWAGKRWLTAGEMDAAKLSDDSKVTAQRADECTESIAEMWAVGSDQPAVTYAPGGEEPASPTVAMATAPAGTILRLGLSRWHFPAGDTVHNHISAVFGAKFLKRDKVNAEDVYAMPDAEKALSAANHLHKRGWNVTVKHAGPEDSPNFTPPAAETTEASRNPPVYPHGRLPHEMPDPYDSAALRASGEKADPMAHRLSLDHTRREAQVHANVAGVNMHILHPIPGKDPGFRIVGSPTWHAHAGKAGYTDDLHVEVVKPQKTEGVDEGAETVTESKHTTVVHHLMSHGFDGNRRFNNPGVALAKAREVLATHGMDISKDEFLTADRFGDQYDEHGIARGNLTLPLVHTSASGETPAHANLHLAWTRMDAHDRGTGVSAESAGRRYEVIAYPTARIKEDVMDAGEFADPEAEGYSKDTIAVDDLNGDDRKALDAALLAHGGMTQPERKSPAGETVLPLSVPTKNVPAFTQAWHTHLGAQPHARLGHYAFVGHPETMKEAHVGKIDKAVWARAEAAAVKSYGAKTRDSNPDKFYGTTMKIYKNMVGVKESAVQGLYTYIYGAKAWAALTESTRADDALAYMMKAFRQGAPTAKKSDSFSEVFAKALTAARGTDNKALMESADALNSAIDDAAVALNDVGDALPLLSAATVLDNGAVKMTEAVLAQVTEAVKAPEARAEVLTRVSRWLLATSGIVPAEHREIADTLTPSV